MEQVSILSLGLVTNFPRGGFGRRRGVRENSHLVMYAVCPGPQMTGSSRAAPFGVITGSLRIWGSSCKADCHDFFRGYFMWTRHSEPLPPFLYLLFFSFLFPFLFPFFFLFLRVVSLLTQSNSDWNLEMSFLYFSTESLW